LATISKARHSWTAPHDIEPPEGMPASVCFGDCPVHCKISGDPLMPLPRISREEVDNFYSDCPLFNSVGAFVEFLKLSLWVGFYYYHYY
jgi:hypothetical protein